MKMNMNHYHHLLIMTVLSFISMYILMYAMVDVIGNVYPSFNQFYMAALMTAPMVLIELVVMGAMYQDKRLNTIIIMATILIGVAAFIFIRQQVAITDRQFLKSMIPHHAGAILMCEHANLQDPDNQALCDSIIAGQQAEIDQMKARLNERDK
jgi:hypothetical protein